MLVHEPTNPVDADAIAVFSARGIQIGYIVADRTNIIHKAWQATRGVRAIFQEAITGGAAIRVGFDQAITDALIRHCRRRETPRLNHSRT